MHSVAVLGTGYVGLTTGAYLAHLGHRVTCADVDAAKVRALRQGMVPIVEDGLEAMVREGIDAGRLSFVIGGRGAVGEAEFVFLCLPTPQGADGSADIGYVLTAAAEIGPHLRPGTVVVNKSTVPVGTTRMVATALARRDVSVVFNPEFLREGTALRDCLQPDRIIVASDDPEAMVRVGALYAELGAPVIHTDLASAEMIKYASNAFLATRLSFVNAIATLCERVGADARDVLLGMGHDRRIGFDFLSPGPGWGGSCLPKDTKALLRLAEDYDHDFNVLRGAIDDNRAQSDSVAARVEWMAGGSLVGANVAVWGLAFKAGTNDLRDSPALEVIARLVSAGAAIQAYDPAVQIAPEGVTLMPDLYDAVRNADILVILTEWPEFAHADLEKVRDLMAAPRIMDARNVLPSQHAGTLGFLYEGVGITSGRGVAPPTPSRNANGHSNGNGNKNGNGRWNGNGHGKPLVIDLVDGDALAGS
jgi:UDPglucose 6-dehydrogenase